MRKVLAVGIVGLGLLAGCSGSFGTMDRIMSSWQGSTLEDAIGQWGYPDQKQEIAGKTLYHWDKVKSFTTPINTSGTATVYGNTAYLNTTTTGGQTLTGSCRRTLVVNEKDVIVSTEWKGNNCPFMDVGMGYQYWEKDNS